MKAGNKIRVQYYMMGQPQYQEDYIVEEFRYCLGIFETDGHRTAGRFTPLCGMFERGPESESGYISNFGDYVTNEVQGWMDLP